MADPDSDLHRTKRRKVEGHVDSIASSSSPPTDRDAARRTHATAFPPDQDPKLLHYLDGHLIIRHSHFPFASGGFCDVYIGHHPIHGKVAMRRPRMTEEGYSLSRMTDFFAESEIWKKLRHPNILQFLGFIQSDGNSWAVSSFAENGPLPEYLKRYPRTDRRVLVHQLADAIRYLHRQGIVHGDIKGSNMLVSTSGTILLSDFGLSKLSGAVTRSSLSGAGSTKWCAPELLMGEAKTPASDVYAFGMTLYEILSGNVPFYDLPNDVLVIKAINEGRKPPKEPAASESGDSYEPLWDLAAQSWDGDPFRRPTMKVACQRLGVPATSLLGTVGEGASIIQNTALHSLSSTSAIVANSADHRFAQPRVSHVVSHDGHNATVQQSSTERYRLIANPFMGISYPNQSRIESGYPKTQMSEDEALIRWMPRAYARYDDPSTRPSRPCHPGTRDPLLQAIRDWTNDDSTTNSIFWLCGEVGVGKTTVAHTVATEQDALQQLGASFFFNRDNDQRRQLALFATTIAYQLTRFDTSTHQRIAATLRLDLDIVHRDLPEQFLKLVVQPLFWVGGSSFRKVVIVIDGLDECSDPTPFLDVLPLLTKHAVPGLRVLVTSRPHAAIITRFNRPRLCHLTNRTQFREIDPEILENDVTAYLEWSLGDIASDHQKSLPSPWASPKQIESLVRLASGLFSIANIYIRYIRDPIEGNPSEQLERILSRRKPVEDSPTAELDSVYDMVLHDVKWSLSGSAVGLARSLLQLAFLSSPRVSVRKMTGVLGSTLADVESILQRLTSVIRLSSGEEVDDVVFSEDEADGENVFFIVPFHASFGEYIQDPERCSVKEFLIEPESSHAELAVIYLEIFIYAAEDRTTGLEDDEIEMLPTNFQVAAHRLPYHLSLVVDPAPTQLRQAKEKFLKDAFWTWLYAWYCNTEDASDGRLVKKLKECGFAAEYGIGDKASLRLSTMKRVLDLIPQLSVRQSCPADSPSEARYEGSRIVDNTDLEVFKTKLRWESALGILRLSDPRGLAELIRKWGNLEHPNIVPLLGIDFKSLLELAEDHESVIYTPSTSHYPALRHHWYPSLLHASQRNPSAAIEFTLEIAYAIRYLSELAPYQRLPIWDVRLEDIVLSKAGKAMIHPLFLASRDDAEQSPMDAERKSLSERGIASWDCPIRFWEKQCCAVWKLGCIIYEIMTGEPPLKRYQDLAMGKELFDDESMFVDAPLKAWRAHIKTVQMANPKENKRSLERRYWQVEVEDVEVGVGTIEDLNIRHRRYQSAVRHLLNDLQGSEDLKDILRVCWEVNRKDVLTIQDIVERLETVREAWQNRGTVVT